MERIAHENNASAVAYLRWKAAPWAGRAEDERALMERAAAALGLDLHVIEEVGSPGEGYAAVRNGLRSGRYGTLLMVRLDRVGRSREAVAELLSAQRREGWRLVAARDGIDTDALEDDRTVPLIL